MKSSRFVRTFSALAVASGACASLGCNAGAALWLQDYGRDLLLSGGALAAALAALGQANEALEQANNANDTAQQALDTADSAQGQPGAPGPQGPTGPAGENGADGQPGPAGADGQSGQDGAAGANGADGADGAQGPTGPAGPEFFSNVIGQFFRPPTNLQGGGGDDLSAPTFGAAVGWRMILSNRYHAGNPVTMRLYIDADYSLDPGRPTSCEQFRIAAVRMRNGAPVEPYGSERFVLIDIPENGGQVFMVIDLPLNTANGLDLPNDLAAGQLLGVGMEWSDPECTTLGRNYRIFGVEFFESPAGSAQVSGATISDTQPDCNCGGGK